ncbi:MAG: carbohydrate ABC transporter permease [Oscillospiraceae bacterium]|nr:carbohydrate ABC transporter permease [Oscillospiraceae bacterium]
MKKKFSWFDFTMYTILILICIVTIYPFLNVLALSFNNSGDSIRGGIYIFPRKFTLDNYRKVFTYSTIWRASINSLLRTVIGTALGVIFTSMTAFVLSRKDFMFRRVAMLIFALTMYVSGGLIPSYLLIRQLGLMNNFAVYIIPGIVSVWCIILMRTYMDSLPFSLQESAMIDGANDFYIYYRIILPLCLPSVATIALFFAVSHWNSWFDAYLYTSGKPNLSLLQFELQKILQDTMASSGYKPTTTEEAKMLAQQVTPKSIQMAITVIVTVPIMVVYPFIQKYFIKGMTIGSVKG